MSFYNWDMLPLSHDRPGVAHRRIFGDRMQMQHLLVEPGGEPATLHNHPNHEEFFYIQAGEWEFTLEDEVRRIGPGDVVHVKAGAMPTLRLLSNEAGMVLEVFHPIWNADLATDKEQFTIDAISRNDRLALQDAQERPTRHAPAKAPPGASPGAFAAHPPPNAQR